MTVVLANILLWITATAPPLVHFQKMLLLHLLMEEEYTDALCVWNKVLLAKVQGSPQGRKRQSVRD